MKITEPDYNEFYLHHREYVRKGIPLGFKGLIRLAMQYNCPVPKLVDGELVFEE
jgi:hypothetical protein